MLVYSVSAAPACAAAAVGMSSRCQVKMGIPSFGDLGSQNIYDTRLNGETLFSDFRWCHGELLLVMHGAADDAIAA